MDSLRRVPSFEPPSDSSRTDLSNPASFSKPFQAYSPSIKYTYYSNDTDIRQAWSLDALLQPGEVTNDMFSGSKEPFWIDIVTPNSDDLSRLASVFGVHPLSIEDVQMADSREKCEIFEHYLFLCIQTCDQKFLSSTTNNLGRRPSMDGLDLNSPAVLYMLVFQNYVISIHHEPIPHIRRVLRRMYGLKTSQLALSSDWVMYSLLDDAVDEFLPQMQNLELEVDTIDELVLFLTHSEQSDMLRRIGRARKRVTHLQRLLKPKIEILKILTTRCPEFLREHTLIYLRDVNDHVLTDIQNLEQYSETLNRSHSNYLAHISIELNEASNRMNIVMKKLTAAAALVLPLSLVSGIWGMNVAVPGQPGIDGWVPLIPFFIIVTLMMVMMVAMYYIGHYNDWW
ncbi:Mg2+, CorA-like/Zinc transporter domain-containing protein [Paramicrosporidium saccamoebae]|uniref:Mg2+, CorA-like/Zinc transporter domain-containing protein n=1 Tax=Paramicrosporidium saccamoebae TaxID=1246581 RepID=A0A2H9TJ42_9FUNG|nr:Mg2+, CorA-like/Zinc transporter domain-containing protein [Paramicrosporidium saccamoebae]